MMRLRRATVLLALSLLTSAATASAECAWVLWDEYTMHRNSYKTSERNIPGGAPSDSPGGGEWLTMIGAHPTYAACEEAQAWKINQMLKDFRKQKADEPPTFTMGKGGGGKYTISYVPGTNIIGMKYERVDEMTVFSYETHKYNCFPDTVDPRGPKGR
jgi:hypothetical protein